MSIKSVDIIAKTEKLTRNVLLREIFPEHNESTYFKEKKKELISDLECISSRNHLEERVVIYCFLCMWKAGLVKNLNFWESFNENGVHILLEYINHYYKNIHKLQQKLWQE